MPAMAGVVAATAATAATVTMAAAVLVAATAAEMAVTEATTGSAAKYMACVKSLTSNLLRIISKTLW